MNNDLISRKALRKDIEHLYSVYADNKDWFYTDVLNHIDNAPTVETPCEQESELIKAYTKGFNTGVEIVKNARLQGEWITNGEFDSKDVCSVCKKRFWYRCMTIDLNRIEDIWNFCPNCGAEMQKGGADNG